MPRAAYPNDLTDDEWNILEPILPPEPTTGKPRKWSLREILNAFFYVLRGGIACLGQNRPGDRGAGSHDPELTGWSSRAPEVGFADIRCGHSHGFCVSCSLQEPMTLFRGESLLLGNALAPLTHSLGFLQCPVRDVVRSYQAWMTQVGHQYDEVEVHGTLEHVLRHLTPLSAPHVLRHLFIPVQGGWTAYLNNFKNGPDIFPTVSYHSKTQGWRGVRVDAVPDSVRRSKDNTWDVWYRALVLEVYGNAGDLLGYERSVSLLNDGGRWSFIQSGDPFDFEDLDVYARPRLKDRFTFDLLVRYCAALGLRPFAEEFYLTPQGAVLLQRPEPPPRLRDASPAEVQALFSKCSFEP